MSAIYVYFRRKNPYYGGDDMRKEKKESWWLVATERYDEEDYVYTRYYLVKAVGPIAAKRKIVAACFSPDVPEKVVEVEKIEEDNIVCVEEDENGGIGCAKIFK